MTPTVQGETLVYRQDGQEQVLTVGTAAWFSWLETASTFSFVSETGSFTARREQSGHKRGGWYWKAYRKQHGKLSSRYLGKSETVTLARLQAVAQALADAPVGASHVKDVDAAVPPAQAAAHGMRGDSLTPLLATKLHRPLPRAQLVRRPHLAERLTQGVVGPLTLVSAPAGFGKTTLLAQWLSESGTPVAWLSLEPQDNEPVRFLSYLIAALQTLDPRLGSVALPLLQASQPAASESVLTLLANDVLSRARDREDFALVLDDYHVIEAAPIHQALLFLLEHLPPQMHLILLTRADPPLPLSRLRARGQLTELRAAELRFATQEVQTFLRTVMGLDLSAQEMAFLQQRTEGWIAGLQFAALSLRGRTDVSAFLSAFTGSHRFVLDYLTDEVLARQSAAVQAFLLSTSILERLSGSLCEWVTEQEGGQTMLEALERANMFMVPLDEERQWYRYHHLFTEVLRNRLQQAEPKLVPELHRRASAWYAQHGLEVEAVQHALAASDVERAADLIEHIDIGSWAGLGAYVHRLLSWLGHLPDALVRARPMLSIIHAVALTFTNQFQEAEAHLQAAEHCLDAEVPPEQARFIRGYVAAVRGNMARYRGDLACSVALSQEALALLPEEEVSPRPIARVNAAHSFLVSGDVTTQQERFTQEMVASQRASANLSMIMRSFTTMARLQIMQGRLRQAAKTFEEAAWAVPGQEDLRTTVGSPAYYFGLADILREWNELSSAERLLEQGMELINGGFTVDAEVVTLGYITLARLQIARGAHSQALTALDTFTHLANARSFAPYLLARGMAVRARVELVQGNVRAATGWAEQSGNSTEDENLDYPREQEYLTLARVDIVQGRDDPAGPFLREALHLLDRLLEDAEAKARMGSTLEILVLQSLTLHALGDRARALSTLERALRQASPEGYVRLFVDEGTPMLSLLHQARQHSLVPDYVAALLSAFDAQTAAASSAQAFSSVVLLEPLTERELEVLRLLVTGLSNAAMAQQLVITVGTVKRHLNSIYGKLGVQSRTQAVARAHTLHVL